MCNDKSPFSQTHAFIVRIWWEAGLTWSDGRPLWRGQVQDAASGQSLVFQSLDELSCFIQDQAGILEEHESEPARRQLKG